jgi:hypothetical protein|tara:strand:- start:251 stop:832 length:582 start_codon:yes stop_codon:yes gene_type:complete
MDKLIEHQKKEPITARGDVYTLRHLFDGDMTKFVYAWALREPILVEAYYEGGFEAVEKIRDIKYQFIPHRTIKWLKPSMIQSWSLDIVVSIGEALQNNLPHDIIMERTKELPGLAGAGSYNSEHLYRTACIVLGRKHPSREFVIMGSGTDYSELIELGIKNMDEMDKKWREITNIPYIDAGELAYLVCKTRKV